MSRRRDPILRQGFAIFRWLPPPVRRRLVRWASPRFTAGTICVVVDGDLVLLVRHSYRKWWGLPGGLLGRRELPDATVVRETSEEVGLAITIIEGPNVIVRPRLRRVDFVYLAHPAVGSDPHAASPRSPEIVEVRWAPLDSLPELQLETADALRAVGLRPVSPSPRRRLP